MENQFTTLIESSQYSQEKSGSEKTTDDGRTIAERNWRAYVQARDAGHLDYVKQAQKFDAYYRGDQWDDADVAALDAEGRPHQTINLCLSTVNAIAGQHIKTRQDITFAPSAKGAMQPVADALTAIGKQIQTNNKSSWNEQTVVLDGCIEDRGFFDMRIDFSDNIQGEVREKVLNPRNVILDPGADEYDPATWNQVIVTSWLTPDEIEAIYGEGLAEELRNKTSASTWGYDSAEFDQQAYGEDFTLGKFVYEDNHRADVNLRRIRVIERQYKKLAKVRRFVDIFEGDTRLVPENWDDEKAKKFADDNKLDIIEFPERKIRWTVSADNVLLFDDWSLYTRFTIIPFFPYFRRGRPFGIVRNLISPQDTLNKVTSQELHVVNTTANSGWIFESGSLVNMDADDLARMGAKTGLALEFVKGSAAPVKIQPNQVPTGLTNISAKAQVYFREISGVNEAMLGQASREISGVAVNQQSSQGLNQTEVIFDNLAKTRQLRAEFMLELIQSWYTETRLISISSLDVDGNEQQKQLAINSPDAAGAIHNDLTLGEYKTVVTSMPHSEAQQDSAFSQAVQLREAGVYIPDYVIIENSRIPNKMEVSKIVKEVQNMAEPTEQEVMINMKRQEMELQSMQLGLRELAAKASEREANAQKTMIEAGITQQQPLLEMTKFGAELRKDMDKQIADIQSSREDLMARIRIMELKNLGNSDVAQIQSMTKRVEGANRAVTEEKKIAAVAGSRSSKERK